VETNSRENRIRIDKWLWYARQAKSRSIAQKLIASGKVRVNREKVASAAKLVGADDVVTLTLSHDIKILKIIKCGDKRHPFAHAQLLYENLSPPKPERDLTVTFNGEPVVHKRPDKKARQQARILAGKAP